jgi:ectoine hydroxylase-related dioxygenase (phytanoyl-CoA dioxygenase family)
MATSAARAVLDFDRATLPWLDRCLVEITDYVKSAEPDPARQTQLREQLLHWMHFGYLTLPRAIEPELIDAYLADIYDLFDQREKHSVLISAGYNTYVPVKEYKEKNYYRHGFRIIDFHNSSVAAKKMSLHRSITSMLRHIFRDTPVAMQSLTFMKGTQQEIHQDYAYVIADIPSHLTATWIALEDIHPDAGPLVYYPGSHTIPKFDWGDGIFRTQHSTRNEQAFAEHIHSSCKAAGLTQQAFTPRKGDVFIWHGALAHGGALAVNPELTRKSYVTHYSTAAAFKHDYRAKDHKPFAYEINGGLVYRHPHCPQEEDVFTRGKRL